MSESYQTNRRQLYMLPTSIGWWYGFIVFALLIASIKYSHQGAFLLTFLLAAIGQVTSLYTHKNLLRIIISARNAKPVFAGETAEFPITIKNPSNKKKHAVWLLCAEYSEHFSLEVEASKKFTAKISAEQRGTMKLPNIILSSHFPIGILFSWTKAFPAPVSCIVYPTAKNLLPTPDLLSKKSNEEDESNSKEVLGGDEFSSLKNYQQGDRLRDIHWPSLAKTQQLISKEFSSAVTQSKEFNWEQVASLGTEEKLSQLTYWINEAEKNQEHYQLNIPGFTSTLDLGAAHHHQCLSVLANWPKAGAAQ